MWNISFLHIIKTLLTAKQNVIFMQNENEFNTEKFKGFKLKKAFIYIRKSTYELKS